MKWAWVKKLPWREILMVLAQWWAERKAKGDDNSADASTGS